MSSSPPVPYGDFLRRCVVIDPVRRDSRIARDESDRTGSERALTRGMSDE